jgi:DNA helicase HerA-like ATPase
VQPSDLKARRIGETSSSDDVQPGFDTIPFHVEPGQRPALDAFAVVGRDTEGTYHYGRIAAGTEFNPKADPSMLQQNQSYGFDDDHTREGDLAPNVTRVMEIDLLGEVVFEDGDAEIRQPTQLPQTGQPVWELPASQAPALLTPDEQEEGEGLDIGEIESGGESEEFDLPTEAIPRHISILGKTGVGKTHTAHVLVEELVGAGVPVVHFDLLEDAVNMADDLGGRTVRPDQDLTLPYSLVGYQELRGFVPGMTSKQEDVVSVAYDAVYTEAMDQLRTNGEVDVPVQRLYDEIEDIGKQMDTRARKGAFYRVRTAYNNSPLLGEEMDDWGDLLGRNPLLNVYIGHLGQDRRNTVVGAMSRMLQKLRRHDEVPPFVLVIDEAHKFIPSGRDTSPSTRVVRELVQMARHDGIGVVLISQSPSSLDKQSLRTCNTHVVMSLDREELTDVKGMFGDLSDTAIERIPKLEKGKAMIASGRDILRHPAPVSIRDRRTEEGAPTPDLIAEAKRWRQQRLGLGGYGDESKEEE